MDTTTKRYTERPKASLLSIINFIMLCLILIFVLSMSSKLGNQQTEATNSNSGTNTTQDMAALNTKIDNLTASLQATKSPTTKPFTYLSCNGSAINSGSTSTINSQCYPY